MAAITSFAGRFQRLGLLLFLMVLALFFTVASPYFLARENIVNILIQSTVPVIVSVGMTIVIATAGIDLSVGSILALSGIIMAWAMKAGFGVAAGVTLGVLSGAIMGAANGFAIARLAISPFIVTLGTAGVFRALALIFTEARPIYDMPGPFRMFAIGRWGFVPRPVLLAAAVAGIAYLIIGWTRFGTNARAVGDNPNGAFRMGVPVAGTLVAVYATSGLIAALAGVVVTARLNTAEAIAGLGVELQAIAAVVMGGTSFFGGEASIGGTLLGALIIGVLGNGLTILNVPSYYQQLVIGLVFILAVAADRLRRKGKFLLQLRSRST
ncbi:MAG: ABC transporter permease [Syntrophorhabdales bacterium]|jgi:ribose/xylose/arabinose/galactoside ABC-type transport system permease subunit